MRLIEWLGRQQNSPRKRCDIPLESRCFVGEVSIGLGNLNRKFIQLKDNFFGLSNTPLLMVL